MLSQQAIRIAGSRSAVAESLPLRTPDRPHRGVEDAARAASYSVILCNADRDIGKEREYLRVVADQNASGVIISPASARKTDVSDLIARGLPVIAVDMSLAHSSGSVLVDNKEAGALATRHLITRGCRRIACITERCSRCQ